MSHRRASNNRAGSRPAWVGPMDEVGVTISQPAMGGADWIKIGGNAQKHVDAYLEYHRIVGDADGGQLFTLQEYEDFKQRAREVRAVSRMYVSWRNPSGIDCKNIGPQTKCICGHMYKQHVTDSLRGDQIHAKDTHCRQCACKGFAYLPGRGSWTVKCGCKHEHNDHDSGRKLRPCRLCRCAGFHSSYSCDCSATFGEHATVVETRAEREAAGRPVDNLCGVGGEYEALGAVTDFRSLAPSIDHAGPSACLYTCLYACLYACVYTCPCTYLYACIYTYLYTGRAGLSGTDRLGFVDAIDGMPSPTAGRRAHMPLHMPIHIPIHMPIHILIHMFVRMSTHMFIPRPRAGRRAQIPRGRPGPCAADDQQLRLEQCWDSGESGSQFHRGPPPKVRDELEQLHAIKGRRR